MNLSGNQNLTPTFVFKKEMLTRYVVIVEDTKDMMERVRCRAAAFTRQLSFAFESFGDSSVFVYFFFPPAQESWNFLRLAIRKWAVHDLPPNTEVGLVSANDSSANRLHGLSRLQSSDARDQVASNIPYSTGDSRPPACLACAFKEAIQVRRTAP